MAILDTVPCLVLQGKGEDVLSCAKHDIHSVYFVLLDLVGSYTFTPLRGFDLAEAATVYPKGGWWNPCYPLVN